MRRLEGKVALVTGGANGLGRATGLRLAREGADVCIVDREEGALETAAAELRSCGGRVLAITADCLRAENVTACVQRTRSELGPIDVLVNNIGQSARERQTAFVDSTEEVWRFVFEVNVFTCLRFTREVAPSMCERRFGRIINLSSDAALVGPLKSADYAASKAAILGFTRATAREFGPSGVTVNAILPGPMRTRAMIEANAAVVQSVVEKVILGHPGEPEDIAAMVAHLASEDGRFITGQSIPVNGGVWWL
jgi:NAD(P)-dependent dehydrogenase (short-subunit alcohol dehydrogenase family)